MNSHQSKILTINSAAASAKAIRFDKASSAQIVSTRTHRLKLNYLPSQGYSSFINQVVELENRKHKRQLSADNLLITNGATEAIYLILKTLVGNQSIILHKHSFELFYLLSRHLNIKVKSMNLHRLNTESLSDPNVKAVLISNPENPTGKIYDQNELLTLYQFCKQNSLYLIIDEAANQLVYEKIFFLPKQHLDRTIFINTISKNYFAPGLRVGWVIAKSSIISQLSQTKECLNLHTGSVNQIIAGKIIKQSNKKALKELNKKRALVNHMLKQYPQFKYEIPQGGTSYWIKTKRHITPGKLNQLIKAGVAIIPGGIFGKRGTHYFRLSFSNVSNAQIIKGVKILAQNL